MKILFDTNIILDLIDPDRKNSSAAIILYDHLSDRGDEILISADSITTIIHILRRSGMDAIEIVDQIVEYLTVVEINYAIIKKAISIVQDVGMSDYEDAQILAAALSDVECAAIVTNDKEFLKINVDDIEIVSLDDALNGIGWKYNEILQEWIAPDPQQNIYSGIKSTK